MGLPSLLSKKEGTTTHTGEVVVLEMRHAGIEDSELKTRDDRPFLTP